MPLGLAVAAGLLAAAPAGERYVLDQAASNVTAKVAFFGIASKTARFPKVSGHATLTGRDPATLTLDVTIDAQALEAPDKVTLARLRGEKFFWVERYPKVRFTGSGLKMADASRGVIDGQLTARGVTRTVRLKVAFDRPPAATPPGQALAIVAETAIDRRDFGMTAYPLIVGRKVAITIRTRMTPA